MTHDHELDTGDLVNDRLYNALDKLYERGWVDRNKERDYDPRGTQQWQDVLDLFRLQAAKREPVAQDAMAKDVMVERLAKHLCSKKYPNQDIEFQGGNEFKLWEYHIIEANEYLAIALTTPRVG